MRQTCFPVASVCTNSAPQPLPPPLSTGKLGLIGTTKSTIESVRSRQHWNATNLKAVDPVTLGLTTQIELDAVVSKAAAKRAQSKEEKDARLSGPTLRKVVTPPPAAPVEETTTDGEEPKRDNITAEQLFANFGKTTPSDE